MTVGVYQARHRQVVGDERIRRCRPTIDQMVWHTVDISPDSRSFAVRIAGVDVLMIDTGGNWLAVEDRCSHADCAFSSDGEIDGATLICNCHGSEFDARTGDVLVPPAFDPIRTFPVRVRRGRLEFEL